MCLLSSVEARWLFQGVTVFCILTGGESLQVLRPSILFPPDIRSIQYSSLKALSQRAKDSRIDHNQMHMGSDHRWISKPELPVEYAGQPAIRFQMTDTTSSASLTMLAHRQTLPELLLFEASGYNCNGTLPAFPQEHLSNCIYSPSKVRLNNALSPSMQITPHFSLAGAFQVPQILAHEIC